VLYRLDTTELADALAGRSNADERIQRASEALDHAQTRLQDLAGMFAAEEITKQEWMAARRPVMEQVIAAQKQLATITRTDALTGLVGQGEKLAASWSDLNLDRQHAIVTAMVDHIVVGPGRRGARSLDPDRASVIWRY
jgi:site-specific DNA recombinase